VCQHGHGNHGRLAVIGDGGDTDRAREIRDLRYDYGLALAQSGYHVAAIDLFGFGSRTEPRAPFARRTGRDPCDLAALFLSIAGMSSVALQVNEIRRAVTLLQETEGVAAERIGMAGLSLGGRMAMYAGAVDPRLKVLVASGACNTFRDRVAMMSGACGAQILPGLFPRADTPELFAAMAPRPLQIQWGIRDPLIVAEYAEAGIDRIERAYRAAQAEDRLSVHRFDGGHEFEHAPAVAWFDRWL
jgi:dienelactone hydrolase